MIRGAVLAEGRSYQLQALLDAVFFREIPEFELAAVIAPQEDSPALSKARSAGVAGTVVDPDLFPSTASYCKAVSNKLKDMDIDLVILADYSMPLGEVTKRFRNRIIAVCPCLIPAFENFKGDMYQVLCLLSYTDHVPLEAINKELSRHESNSQQAIIMELSCEESCCSAGNNQAAEQAGITQHSWQLSSR